MSDLLIPIAISSQLDVTGEERVHAAKYNPTRRETFVPAVFETFMAVSSLSQTPHVWAYAYTEGGTALTVDTQPGSVGRGVKWSYDGQHCIFPHDASPFFSFYKRVGNALLKQPSITFSSNKDIGWSAAWNRTSTRLALGMRGNTTSFPFVAIFSRSGDTYTQITSMNDATNVSLKRVNSLSYNDDGTLLAVSVNNNPGLALYSIAADVYTKVASPGTIPTGNGVFTCFSPDGNYLSYSHSGLAAASPFKVYSVSGTSITSVFSDTTDGPANMSAWSDDGAYVAYVISDTATGQPKVKVLSNNAGVFTLVATINLAGETSAAVAFSPTRLRITVEESNKILAYTIGSFAHDAASDITLPASSDNPAEYGLSIVTTQVS